nr:hypothetical protein [Desulfatibacillum aliphaticivorans]
MDSDTQKEFREDFGFYDGTGQWTKEDRDILKEQNRPCLTFPVCKGSVDLVVGVNSSNPVRMVASPVEPSDGFLCEVLNDVVEWVSDENNFEDREEELFESVVICGRGHIALDFSIDPKRFGEIILNESVVPVHEIRIDPASRERDGSDANHIFWDRWVTREDFKIRYPEFADRVDEFMETGRASSFGESPDPKTDENIFDDLGDDDDYDRPIDANYYDLKKDRVRVCHMEYWEAFKRHVAFNPETQEWEEFDPENIEQLKVNYILKYKTPFEYNTMMDKKVKWLQFIGDEILYDGDSPMPYDGFSVVTSIANTDPSRRSNNHFGVIRLMKDPQREINKRWSQALNLLNNMVQPGTDIEDGAVPDIDQYSEARKTPGGVGIVSSGALRDGKIKERSAPQFPSAPMQMEQMSQDIIRKITGINPDLLGQDSGRQEPGVVVQTRQRQGLILLQKLFKEHKRVRREIFKRVIAIISKYMPDGQILRILGGNEKYQIENGMVINPKNGMAAAIRDIRNLKFNVDIEEAPGNLAKDMLQLQVFMEMMHAGFPVDPKTVIEKLQLPATEKQRWIEYIDAQQQAQAQAAQQAQQLEAQKVMAGIQTEAKKVDGDIAVKTAKVRAQAQKDSTKFAHDREREDRKFVIDAAKLDHEDSKMVLDAAAKFAALRNQGNRESRPNGNN